MYKNVENLNKTRTKFYHSHYCNLNSFAVSKIEQNLKTKSPRIAQFIKEISHEFFFTKAKKLLLSMKKF